MWYSIFKQITWPYEWLSVSSKKRVIDAKFKLSPYRKNIIGKFKDEYGIKITKSIVPKLVSILTNKKQFFMQNY